MQNVLADLALESEAATALFARIARSIDESDRDPQAAALKRIGTAVGKYYVCKRAPAVVGEALECLGGNGYVEESILPRLYRESPLNSIWEGSGNINALDVLRIVQKQPESLEALRAEIAPTLGDPRMAAAARALEAELRDTADLEVRGRFVAERLALLWQASLLLQHAPHAVSDAFVVSRIAGDWGRTLGTLPAGTRTARDRRSGGAVKYRHFDRRARLLAQRPWTDRERRIVWRGLTGRMAIAIEPLIGMAFMAFITWGIVWRAQHVPADRRWSRSRRSSDSASSFSSATSSRCSSRRSPRICRPSNRSTCSTATYAIASRTNIRKTTRAATSPRSSPTNRSRANGNGSERSGWSTRRSHR